MGISHASWKSVINRGPPEASDEAPLCAACALVSRPYASSLGVQKQPSSFPDEKPETHNFFIPDCLYFYLY